MALKGKCDRLFRYVFCGLCLLFVFWDVLKRVGFHGTAEFGKLLVFCECVMAGMLLMRVDWKKNRWSWPLLLFFPLVMILCILRRMEPVNGSVSTLERGLFVFVDLSLMWLLLDEREIKTFLSAFVLLGTIFYAALSAAAIWNSAHGIAWIYKEGWPKLGIETAYGNRMSIFAYCTVCAEELCISIIMAMMGIALCKKRLAQVMCFICLFPLTIALALTGARASVACAAGGIGLVALIGLNAWKPFGKKPLRWAGGCVAALAVVVAAFMLISSLVGVYNDHLTKWLNAEVPGVATASAEETAVTEEDAEEKNESISAAQRGLGNNLTELVSGRNYVWRAFFQTMKDHPGFLVLGGSIEHAMDTVNPYTGAYFIFDHMHSMPMQIVVELGLGALALYLWFVFLFARASFRLMFHRTAAMWQRLLPVPAICLLVAELFECVSKLSYAYPSSALLMLFAGATLAMDCLLRKEKKSTKD